MASSPTQSGSPAKSAVGRPPGPTVDRAVRREDLLDAAVRAIESHGPGVSMQQVADSAGVTRPIFYSHFGDRSGLSDAVLERYAKLFSTIIEAGFNEEHSATDAVVAAFSSFCDFAAANENLYRFLRVAATSENSDTALEEIAGVELGKLIAIHLVDRGLDPEMGEVWGRGLLAMALGMAEWWLTEKALPRDVLIARFRSFLELGLGT